MNEAMHRENCRLCARAKRWNDLMLGILPVLAAVIWVIFWRLIQRDWTAVFAPLLVTAVVVLYWCTWYVIYVKHQDGAES